MKTRVNSTTFRLLTTLTLLFSALIINAQTQTIRGTVIDQDAGIPLIGVTVSVLDTDPIIGASN